MSRLYDKYRSIVDEYSMYEKDDENFFREEAKEKDMSYEALCEMVNMKKVKEANFINFRKDVKDMLFYESIKYMASKAIGDIDESINYYPEKYISEWVSELDGVNAIINRNRGKSYVLEDLFNLIEDTTNSIVEKAKVDKADPSVDREDLSVFLDKLDQDGDINNMSQTIAIRVADSEEEFIHNNIADKKAIKSIVDDTSSRISAAKQDDSISNTTADEIAKEETRISKASINDIRTTRPRSIFEEFVRNNCDTIIKNESMHDKFMVNEHVNMDLAVQSARVAYAIAETFNTLELVKFDEVLVKHMLS